MTISKDQLLSLASNLPIEELQVPELNGSVFIRTMTGTERDGYEQSCIEQKGKHRIINMKNVRSKLLVKTLCDKDGKRLFEDKDVEALGSIPANVLDRLYSASNKLSGLSAEDVEELEGN